MKRLKRKQLSRQFSIMVESKRLSEKGSGGMKIEGEQYLGCSYRCCGTVATDTDGTTTCRRNSGSISSCSGSTGSSELFIEAEFGFMGFDKEVVGGHLKSFCETDKRSCIEPLECPINDFRSLYDTNLASAASAAKQDFAPLGGLPVLKRLSTEEIYHGNGNCTKLAPWAVSVASFDAIKVVNNLKTHPASCTYGSKTVSPLSTTRTQELPLLSSSRSHRYSAESLTNTPRSSQNNMAEESSLALRFAKSNAPLTIDSRSIMTRNNVSISRESTSSIMCQNEKKWEMPSDKIPVSSMIVSMKQRRKRLRGLSSGYDEDDEDVDDEYFKQYIHSDDDVDSTYYKEDDESSCYSVPNIPFSKSDYLLSRKMKSLHSAQSAIRRQQNSGEDDFSRKVVSCDSLKNIASSGDDCSGTIVTFSDSLNFRTVETGKHSRIPTEREDDNDCCTFAKRGSSVATCDTTLFEFSESTTKESDQPQLIEGSKKTGKKVKNGIRNDIRNTCSLGFSRFRRLFEKCSSSIAVDARDASTSLSRGENIRHTKKKGKFEELHFDNSITPTDSERVNSSRMRNSTYTTASSPSLSFKSRASSCELKNARNMFPVVFKIAGVVQCSGSLRKLSFVLSVFVIQKSLQLERLGRKKLYDMRLCTNVDYRSELSNYFFESASQYSEAFRDADKIHAIETGLVAVVFLQNCEIPLILLFECNADLMRFRSLLLQMDL